MPTSLEIMMNDTRWPNLCLETSGLELEEVLPFHFLVHQLGSLAVLKKLHLKTAEVMYKCTEVTCKYLARSLMAPRYFLKTQCSAEYAL